MRSNCIQAVSQAIGRQITTAEVKNIEKRIREAQEQLWKTDRQTMTGLTKAQQFALAAERAAKEIKAEAANKQQRVALTILAHDNIKTYLDGKPGLMLDNFKDKLVGNETTSVGSLVEAIRHQALASIADVGEPFLPEWIGFDQGNTKMESVYRELRGEDSKNPAAKDYAKKLAETFEGFRARFNSLGGKIGKLEDWAHPQAHSAYLLFKEGKDKWSEYTRSRMDEKAFVNEDGTLYTDQQWVDFMDYAYDSIVYAGQSHGTPGVPKGYGSRANAHSAHRELHFKDADAYLEYHKKFGEQSLHAALISHIDKMSKDIALLEVMGPNAKRQFDWWQDYAYQQDVKKGISPDKLDSKKLRNERIYNEVAGSYEIIGNKGFARFMDSIRSLNLIALGMSGISTISDFNTMLLTAKYNNLSVSKLMVEEFRALTDADSRRHARRLGIGVQVFSGAIMRHGQEQLANGIAGKVGGSAVTLSGMPFLTEANRQASSTILMDGVYHVVNTYPTLAAIHKADARMMFTHGIDENDFAIWKQAKGELWDDGKSLLLTTNGILNVPGIDPKVLRTSADKFMSLVLDEQNMSVVTPGAEQWAFLKAGTTRGTIVGELTWSAGQFKSFGLTMPWVHMHRAMSQDTKMSSASYAASFFAGSMLFGALIVQLKELANGRDPLAMNNLEFAGRSLLAAGGVGIFGDFLSSQNTKYGTSLVASTAGPTISKMEQLYQATWGNVIKAKQGEKTHFGAEALGLINSMNPLSTLWFTKAAFNHIVLQKLQETLSPGYLRRIEARARREFHQSSWWRLGKNAPQRAPDMSRVIER